MEPPPAHLSVRPSVCPPVRPLRGPAGGRAEASSISASAVASGGRPRFGGDPAGRGHRCPARVPALGKGKLSVCVKDAPLNLALHFQHQSRSPSPLASSPLASGFPRRPEQRQGQGQVGVLPPHPRAGRAGPSRPAFGVMTSIAWNQPRGERLFQENLQLLQVRAILHESWRGPHAARHMPYAAARQGSTHH